METVTHGLDPSGLTSQGNMWEVMTSELALRQEAGDCLLQDMILLSLLQKRRRSTWFSCLILLAALGEAIFIVPQTSLL